MATAGDRIDKFTLVRQLGAGGMGATWEAVRRVGPDFEQRVAIKLAQPDLLNTTDGLASFRREAALAASLRHPNIAAVLDVDENAGYIVCELVDGADLRSVLRAVPGGRMDVPIVVHLLAQISRGLSHAHRRILRGCASPIVHRDMSPGNVVLDYDGNVKIVDFGIAKVLVAGAEIAESVKGKLSYMAPEQAMGGRMDGRVDQYALGVIAYEALSGVRPNDGVRDGETLSNILGGRHVPLQERVANLPPGLCHCVERMLALRPQERFPNMDAVLDALAEFTPKLTIHRGLIPLVVAARQPHTILSENGRFVSRPVQSAPLLRHPSRENAETWGGVRDGVSTRPSALHTAAPAKQLAVTLANTRGRADEVRSPVPAPAPAPRVQPPALPAAPVPVPVPVPVFSAWPQRVFTARLFWRGVTLLGASLFVCVIWVALAPDVWRKLSPELALAGSAGSVESVSVRANASDVMGANTDESALVASWHGGRPASTSDALAHTLRVSVPSASAALPQHERARGVPAAKRSSSPSAASSAHMIAGRTAHDDLVQVRVRVRSRRPGGKVWLDEEVYGMAAPELVLSVRRGTHVIAAGTERGPVERRTIHVTHDRMNVVQFDLEPNRQLGR